MNYVGTNKNRHQNLDMVVISLGDKEVVIDVNSSIFFRSHKYLLQKLNNKYALDGILEQVWELILEKKYRKASKILDKILNSNSISSVTFAKFVVSLFLEEDAFPYLKDSILKKETSDFDDEYRLYLELYGILDSEYDSEALLEYLSDEKEIVAFNKKSFNGNYLEVRKAIKENDFKKAKKILAICKKMQPEFFHLEILDQLLSLVLKGREALAKQKKLQEKKLEQERCKKLIELIKQKDFNAAKEQVELILAYRNTEKKNNYSYHLIWEALEMVSTFENDITFEIPVVSYTYKKENDFLYTFLEAVSVGDFKTALEVGKKCSIKPLDASEPKLKVGTYLIILEHLLKEANEREKEQNNLYQIVQNNIQRGHFIHALELYQNNQVILNHYQSELILDLFQSGIAIEKKEISFSKIYHEEVEEEKKVEQISIEDITSKEEISTEGSSKEGEEQALKQENPEVADEFVVYPVEPLLPHAEPTQEYFVYFVKCLEFGQYEEARYWLTQYGALLKANQIQKRLDHYYYTAEIAYAESLEEVNLISKKEELYGLAYNAMRHYDYEKAITYLDYYEKMDTCRNNKALILKGYIYRKMGRYEEAIKYFIQANSISPNPDAYYFLGDIYYKLHRWKDAIFCYITYNEFYPKENITSYLNLSECYRKLNNYNKSLKYLRISDEINMNQNRGLNLKHRILHTEMINNKKERFRLDKKGKES